MQNGGTFDYVIVGSGAAGSVLAARLAEDAGKTVCVLEAGPPDTNRFIHIPAGFMKCLLNPSINWMFESQPCDGTAGRTIPVPRGKTLGGSTSINGHVYSRGLPSDYDSWEKRGNPGWSYDDILPYFKKSECRIGPGDDQFRGRSGPIQVTDTDWKHPLCEAFISGAGELGIPRSDDYNGAHQTGSAYTQRTIFKGRRVSTYRAFLKPLEDQKNVDVRTNCLVTRVLTDNGRASGLTYIQGEERFEVAAKSEVIICGGAFGSPQLLQLSGIGDPEHLREIGVDCVHELPGVGANLGDHYVVRMTAAAKNIETINERSHGLRLAMEVAKYYAGKPSILGLPSTAVYAFWHSDPASQSSDIQVSFMPASYREGVQSKLDTAPGMSFATWQQRPESTGYVRCRTPDPTDKPLIQANYLSKPRDQELVVHGMRLAQSIMGTQAMEPYVDRKNSPMLALTRDDELLELARSRGTTSFHPMGTCRMGPRGDHLAVVDHNLKVHGIQNLRVVDASIMPSMPSCNISAPTIMIAEKAADCIKGGKLKQTPFSCSPATGPIEKGQECAEDKTGIQ